MAEGHVRVVISDPEDRGLFFSFTVQISPFAPLFIFIRSISFFMACNSHFARNFCPSVVSTSARSASLAFPDKFARLLHFRSPPLRLVALASSLSAISGTLSFTWDDVVQASQPERFTSDDSSDLEGYFEKVKICNRNSEMHSEFLPFIIQNIVVGYIHNGFAEHLKQFQDVFVFSYETNSSLSGHVTLHPLLGTPEDRTRAVGDVISCLGEEHIPGIRNELYPVTSSFGAPIFFSLERAAAPYFGIKAYGVHMNGYVEKGGEKFLWIGKRSATKQTYPGMLDHLVAGGLPHGIACGENLMKECQEEAGIPRSLSRKAVPVGAVSYVDIERFRLKRDCLFCYDLKLPESFIPENQDGEVEEFKLMPITEVANVIRRTHFFKPNCSLVIMDFLFRHGYIKPDCFGYLNLLQSLRSGSCS